MSGVRAWWWFAPLLAGLPGLPGPTPVESPLAPEAALEKCGGGPEDPDIPEMAYLLDGEVVYTGEPPSRSDAARARFDGTPLGSLEGDDVGELELLCWNQAEALVGVEVRVAAFSVWRAPAPLEGVHEVLESIQTELDASHAETGRYSIDREAWSAPHPEAELSFGVEPDGYVVTATHPRMNRVLFVASSGDVSPPGYDRPDGAGDAPGVKGYWKHSAPPLRR